MLETISSHLKLNMTKYAIQNFLYLSVLSSFLFFFVERRKDYVQQVLLTRAFFSLLHDTNGQRPLGPCNSGYPRIFCSWLVFFRLLYLPRRTYRSPFWIADNWKSFYNLVFRPAGLLARWRLHFLNTSILQIQERKSRRPQPFNELTPVFYASVLLLIMNFVITLSR